MKWWKHHECQTAQTRVEWKNTQTTYHMCSCKFPSIFSNFHTSGAKRFKEMKEIAMKGKRIENINYILLTSVLWILDWIRWFCLISLHNSCTQILCWFPYRPGLASNSIFHFQGTKRHCKQPSLIYQIENHCSFRHNDSLNYEFISIVG